MTETSPYRRPIRLLNLLHGLLALFAVIVSGAALADGRPALAVVVIVFVAGGIAVAHWIKRMRLPPTDHPSSLLNLLHGLLALFAVMVSGAALADGRPALAVVVVVFVAGGIALAHWIKRTHLPPADDPSSRKHT